MEFPRSVSNREGSRKLRERVLIVDDDEHIIRVLAEVLEYEELEPICPGLVRHETRYLTLRWSNLDDLYGRRRSGQ